MVFTYCALGGLLWWKHGESGAPDASSLWDHYGTSCQARSHCSTTRGWYYNQLPPIRKFYSSFFLPIVMTYLESAKKKIMPLMEEAKLISDDEANELGRKDVDR